MPYEISKTGCSDSEPYAVRVQGGGRVMGCHKTRAKAQRQMAALYANDPDASHAKTAIKREMGLDFPPRDYAFVPDPLRPATWRLRLTEAPGQISLEQLVRAAAALSPAGFRGNRVEIPPAALSSVKRRLLAEFRRLKVAENKIPAVVKELAITEDGSQFMLWKDVATNQYRWFAVYSNNFRDEDTKPEIISAKSHERFVRMVDDGLVDYPELWLWHIKGTAWGKADWLAYADGFALASGLVYPGYEHIAGKLSRLKDIRVSHGMPDGLIAYDPGDDSVIAFHVTAEISPLPGWAAANKLTGFTILGKGETTMPLQDEKKKFLKEVGLSEEVTARLEANLKELATAATEAGIQSKEAGPGEEPDDEEELPADDSEDGDGEVDDEEETPEPEPTPEPAPPKKVVAKAAAKKDDDEDIGKKTPRKRATKSAYATRDEVADVIAEVAAPLIEGLEHQRDLATVVADLTKEVRMLRKEVKSLKASDEEKLARTKELTPTASLGEIIRRRVIGQEAARVKGNTTLGKDGPKETEPHSGAQPTGISFINGLIDSAQKLSSQG